MRPGEAGPELAILCDGIAFVTRYYPTDQSPEEMRHAGEGFVASATPAHVDAANMSGRFSFTFVRPDGTEGMRLSIDRDASGNIKDATPTLSGSECNMSPLALRSNASAALLRLAGNSNAVPR